MKYDPETVRRLRAATGDRRDERETEDLVKLYTLIWNRFVACQMTPAVFDQTAIDIERGPGRACAPRGQVMKFAGFTRRSTPRQASDDAAAEDDGATDKLLPAGRGGRGR